MPGTMTSSDFGALQLMVGQSNYQMQPAAIQSISELPDVQITDLQDGQILKYNVSIGKWVNVSPSVLTSNEVSGTAIRSGDGINTVFVIPHYFGATPTNVFIEGDSADAEDDFEWSVNETNIILTYTFPPPQGTNNLSFYYRVS